MLSNFSSSSISLPRCWPKNVKSAVLHVISLAYFAITYARAWAANSLNARVAYSSPLPDLAVVFGISTPLTETAALPKFAPEAALAAVFASFANPKASPCL